MSQSSLQLNSSDEEGGEAPVCASAAGGGAPLLSSGSSTLQHQNARLPADAPPPQGTLRVLRNRVKPTQTAPAARWIPVDLTGLLPQLPPIFSQEPAQEGPKQATRRRKPMTKEQVSRRATSLLSKLKKPHKEAPRLRSSSTRELDISKVLISVKDLAIPDEQKVFLESMTDEEYRRSLFTFGMMGMDIRYYICHYLLYDTCRRISPAATHDLKRKQWSSGLAHSAECVWPIDPEKLEKSNIVLRRPPNNLDLVENQQVMNRTRPLYTLVRRPVTPLPLGTRARPSPFMVDAYSAELYEDTFRELAQPISSMVVMEHNYELLQTLEDQVRHLWQGVVEEWRKDPLPGENGTRLPYPEPFLDRHLTLVVARRTLTMLSDLMDTIFQFYDSPDCHFDSGLRFPTLGRLARSFSTMPEKPIDAMEEKMRRIFPRGIESLNLCVREARNKVVFDYRTKNDMIFHKAYALYRQYDGQDIDPKVHQIKKNASDYPPPREHIKKTRAMAARVETKMAEILKAGKCGSVSVIVDDPERNEIGERKRLLESEVLDEDKETGRPKKMMYVYEGYEVPSDVKVNTLVNGAIKKNDTMSLFVGGKAKSGKIVDGEGSDAIPGGGATSPTALGRRQDVVMIGMSEVDNKMNHSANQPQFRQNSETLCFVIPADTFKHDYYIDLAALITVAGPTPAAAPAPLPVGEVEEGAESEEEGEREGEGVEEGRLEGKEKRRRQRRRGELEDYDLGDPFIDDDDVPPGFSLAELLAATGEGEETAPETESGPISVKKSEFYVWRGKLPERELDPLWEEKIKASRRRKGKRKKSSAGKGKRRKPDVDTTDSVASGKESPVKSPKKAKTLKNAEREKNGKTGGKVAKTVKSTRSIKDRVAALGDAEEEEEGGDSGGGMDALVDVETSGHEKGMATSGHRTSRQIDLPEVYVPHPPVVGMLALAADQSGSLEEKVRKKIDSTTPFMELEHRLAMEAFRGEAQKTAFADPKRFPSNLRPLCDEAIVTCLRMQEKKCSLPTDVVKTISTFLPFPAGSLEKLICMKMVPLYRDELRLKVVPELLEALEREVKKLMLETQTSADGAPLQRKTKWSERIKELVMDVIRCEIDWQALDRLHKSYSGSGKAEAFSEISIRKAIYPRIAAYWPEGEMTTAELGKEYSTSKRKTELKKLKEHGIEIVPQLIPIKPKVEEKKNVEVINEHLEAKPTITPESSTTMDLVTDSLATLVNSNVMVDQALVADQALEEDQALVGDQALEKDQALGKDPNSGMNRNSRESQNLAHDPILPHTQDQGDAMPTQETLAKIIDYAGAGADADENDHSHYGKQDMHT